MAVEIIGKSEDVRRYREYLHSQGVLTKRFMDAAARSGQPVVQKPEGFRVFNGGIKNVYNVKNVNGVDQVTKALDPEQKLFIKGIANANMIDRMDERLEPAGIDIENFMKNQVLLLDHLYVASATIGRVVSLEAQDSGVHFEAFIGDPSKAQLTQQQKDARSLIAQRLLQTVSVGFIPHKVQAPVFDTDGKLEEPAVILAWELLELSVVAVPANAGSVFEVGNLGVSLNENKTDTKSKFTSIGNSVKIDETDNSNGDSESAVEAITNSAEDERLMEEKLVELLEQMQRIGTLLGTISESMKTIVDQNEGIIGRLDGEPEEKEEEEEELTDEEVAEDAEEGEEEELEMEEDEEEEEDEDDEKSLEISELKEMVQEVLAKQDEKIEQLSGIMLHLVEKGDKSNG